MIHSVEGWEGGKKPAVGEGGPCQRGVTYSFMRFEVFVVFAVFEVFEGFVGIWK